MNVLVADKGGRKLLLGSLENIRSKEEVVSTLKEISKQLDKVTLKELEVNHGTYKSLMNGELSASDIWE